MAGRKKSNTEPEEQDDNEDTVDDTNRREIRHKYRELMLSMQQNREDMLSSRNNKLTEVLEEANKIFSGVSRAREAALDAQFLVLASNLGKEKASQLHADMTVFDPTSFTEDLLSFMGINRMESAEDDSDNDFTVGFLPSDAWQRLGTEADKYFKKTPTFHYMLGSFKTEPPAVRQKIERQRKTNKTEEKRVMPAQLKKMEESHQEATEKEVERILGFLQTYFREDPDTPISFFDFVIDPDSFARTVENIFHVSFIIRDGFARIKLDQDKLPVIEPVAQENETKVDKDNQPRHQGIISLSQQDWKEIVETFEITEPMIPAPSAPSNVT
ncbi:non-structural maintenance of chromosomes element 4 homolog A [Bombina bombina]|uniref:non-structural maintenance of chromosomes element 4 homolog A n=1 Tax=Bombina bombina TaxID=8345 RepID=UPI00235A9DA9|nr:non-structural maintenance of chromosomes element 4 homolog A [Bombina bombina]